VPAQDGEIQDKGHDEGHDHQDYELDGENANFALPNKKERLRKSGDDPALLHSGGHTPGDDQGAQGDDEGRNTHLGHEKPVHETDKRREDQNGQGGWNHAQPLVDHEPGDQHVGQGHHRAQGEIDSASDDDQCHPNAQQSKDGHIAEHYLDTQQIQERGVYPVKDSAENHQGNKDIGLLKTT